jgi:hypothetical protein
MSIGRGGEILISHGDGFGTDYAFPRCTVILERTQGVDGAYSPERNVQ